MHIDERWPCARCQNKRTVHLGPAAQVCFNCGYTSPSLRHPLNPPRDLFSDAEVLRLMIYRRAVRAGFYTDQLH
jgi:hypothetical protein